MSKNMTYADRLKIEMYLNDGKNPERNSSVDEPALQHDQLRNKERAHETP